MAFKSEAQRRKFHELYKKGKISKEILDAFESETGGRKLPEKVKPPTKPERFKKGKDIIYPTLNPKKKR